MKNTIQSFLKSLRGLKVVNILKGDKVLYTGLILIVLTILGAFEYVNNLKIQLLENKEIIFYMEEKNEVRENVEFLDREIKALYEELEKEVSYESCVNNQLARVINNEPVDFDYCDLIEYEFDKADEDFLENLLKDL